MTQQTDAPSSLGSTAPAPRPFTPAERQSFQDSAARTQATTAYRMAQSANDRALATQEALNSIREQLTTISSSLAKQGETALVAEVKQKVAAGEMDTADAVTTLVDFQLKKIAEQQPAQPAFVPPATPQAPAQPGEMPRDMVLTVGTNSILAAHGLRGNEQGLNLDTTSPRTVLESVMNYQARLKAASGPAAPVLAPDSDRGQPARSPGASVTLAEVENIANQGGSRGALRPREAAAQLKALRAQMSVREDVSFLRDE